MDFYNKKRRWKILLLLLATIIGAGAFFYTNWLIKNMATEERKSVELWAEATQRLASPDLNSNQDITFLNNIIVKNTSIPIIITDSLNNINGNRNITLNESNKDKVLARELEKMKEQNAPIIITISEHEKQYLYYRDSIMLQNLKFYPIVQFGVIFLFILVAYLAFSSSRKAEQNQVWVGMSKETAHQLGTPISSLMAWVELLKMQNIDEKLIQEFEKDTQRLQKITERFSKIGSIPELVPTDVADTIRSTVEYLKTRSSAKVRFVLDFDQEIVYRVPLNSALFSWVIENLCKNAIDAMNNAGTIQITISEKADQVFIDVADTGKGISKAHFKTVFQPGFTTKKRGWGLGLSLAKRIVENYHKGKIFLKHSEINKGTTFRIALNKV
ncbi:MAG TPA: HAMP domain-containing sensor histidine kinase [Prolixibacteraceae bacterium]|nr:HAMP domain-containing sensor histidine kinase [Prolixibacteraceae bacterium]HPR84623.1 HAMP domain-containing sensor histidine kinase [Prolixibacteraceae bacterium]